MGGVVLRTQESWIEKTPGVCGGRACIRRMRFPVWLLVQAKLAFGQTDPELLKQWDQLSQGDLDAAWAYYGQHREEIDHDIQENTEVA